MNRVPHGTGDVSFQPGLHVCPTAMDSAGTGIIEMHQDTDPVIDKQTSEGDTKGSNSPWPGIGIHY